MAGTMQRHGRIPSQEAHEHRKEARLGRKERAYTQAIPSPKKRWQAKNLNPKAHMPFTPQELNAY